MKKKPYEVPENQRLYQAFAMITRPKLKLQMPDCPRGDLNKELGRQWRAMDSTEKKAYTPELLASLGFAAPQSPTGALPIDDDTEDGGSSKKIALM